MNPLGWLASLALSSSIRNTTTNHCNFGYSATTTTVGSVDSSVVKALDSWLKGCGFKSLQENFLLQRQLSVLTLILVTTGCKRSRSFCQKCMWQVTAKHTCTLRVWLCMKWHGAWLCGVHRTCWDGSSFMWHQPCQHRKYTTLVDIQKHAIKSYSLMQNHIRAQELCESRGGRPGLPSLINLQFLWT